MARMWKLVAALAGTLGVISVAHAGEAEIRKSMASLYPSAVVREVNPTKSPAIFEVVVDQEILYTDAVGKFFIMNGEMIDVEGRANITRDRKQELTKINFKDLPLDKATVIVKGDGSRVFATFEDANCGYCKRLHQGMKQLTNYTQYVFVTPMMGEDSRRKADAVWCSGDRAKAVTEMMTANVAPTAQGACKTVTTEVEALAKKLGVTGTPTIFLADGTRIPGFMPPDRLEQALIKAAAVKTADAKAALR